MAKGRDGGGNRGENDRRVVYRIRVSGRIPATWRAWFDADTVTADGDDTLLEVRVADQAELYGRLRRIHDLNLRLLGVERKGYR